jgi:hypothetical protein
MVMEKLSIQNEMAQFDHKNRKFYDDLTDEERKKFSNYLMIRWGSAVQGSTELQQFYLVATNERLNKHFFAINKHPKLQWLCATSVSPDMGTHRHQWIAPKKKEAGSNEVKKSLLDQFPAMKIADIETLSKFVTKKDIKEFQREHGQPDKD